jgi:hypothetical protein
MTDLELIQQALDALEMYELETDSDIQRKAIAALRDRLTHCDRWPSIKALRERLAQPEQEPVAWMHTMIGGDVVVGYRPADLNRHPQRWKPLYATPPAAQQEPTKEMIDAAERIDWADSDVRGNIVNMWQAMLAAAPATQQEPLAQGSKEHLKIMMEEMAWDGRLELSDALANIDEFYTTPPAAAQPAPVPLTDEQIKALMPIADGTAETDKKRVEVLPGVMGYEFGEVDAWSMPLVLQIARAIEAAHGIKE